MFYSVLLTLSLSRGLLLWGLEPEVIQLRGALGAGQEKREKWWLAEMTLEMTSLPLARVFQCLFTFALVSASNWLAEIWQLSRRGATGELEVEFKFQRRSSKLSFLFPPRRHSAPESLLAWERRSPGSDDKIRVLRIRVKSKTFRLPVQMLYH